MRIINKVILKYKKINKHYRLLDFKIYELDNFNLHTSINNKWLKRFHNYRFKDTMSMNIDNEPIGFKTYFPNPKPINISILFEKFTYTDLISLIVSYLTVEITLEQIKLYPSLLLNKNFQYTLTIFNELFDKLKRKINKKLINYEKKM